MNEGEPRSVVGYGTNPDTTSKKSRTASDEKKTAVKKMMVHRTN